MTATSESQKPYECHVSWGEYISDMSLQDVWGATSGKIGCVPYVSVCV